MIELIIPVLGRPERILPLVDNVREETSVEHAFLFLCSPGDGEGIAACSETEERYCLVTWNPGRADFALKTTMGIKMTDAPWLFLGATDLRFESGWDLEALHVAQETGKRVIGTNDKANPVVVRGGHFTHPLVHRTYIEEHPVWDEPGAFYSSAYDHQCVDLEAYDQAMLHGEFAFAEKSVVRHLHPFYDKTVPMDDVYKKALAKGGEDRAIYIRRKRERRHELRRR